MTASTRTAGADRRRSLLLELVAIAVAGALAAVVLLWVRGSSVGADEQGSPALADLATSADERPVIGDHWHMAIGYSRCGVPVVFQPPIVPETSGIHAHGDGLLHVHPSTHAETGAGAVLGLFFDSIAADVADDGLRLASGDVVPFVGTCGGQQARMVLARWDSPTDGTPTREVVHTAAQLRGARLDVDQQVIAIAFLRADDDVPLPSGVDALSRHPTDE